MSNLDTYEHEAFARNIGILTSDEQARISEMTVVIVGLGGVGGIYATSLARLGFAKFRIADPDVFEVVNMNRQAGAFNSTAGKRKVDVMRDLLLDINPHAEVTTFPLGMTDGNAKTILEGADFALDGIDFFAIGARRLFFRTARLLNIPAITAGPIGFGSAMLLFLPKTMSFDDYFDLHDGQGEEEMVLHFGIGICPALLQRAYFTPTKVNFGEHAAPSTVSGTLAAANFVTTELVRMIRGEKLYPAPSSIHFDPFVRRLRRVWMPMGNKNPIQRLKIWIVRRQSRKTQKGP
ncbi:MAG: ThiF family adenylyltransferase [bacterium]|nr:ThiF family adenylyltransferase [bacterium]